MCEKLSPEWTTDVVVYVDDIMWYMIQKIEEKLSLRASFKFNQQFCETAELIVEGFPFKWTHKQYFSIIK